MGGPRFAWLFSFAELQNEMVGMGWVLGGMRMECFAMVAYSNRQCVACPRTAGVGICLDRDHCFDCGGFETVLLDGVESCAWKDGRTEPFILCGTGSPTRTCERLCVRN